MKKLSKILLLSLLLALSFSTNAKVLADDEAGSEVVLRAPVFEYYPYKETYNSYQGDKLWRSLETGGHLYQGYIELTKIINDIVYNRTVFVYEGALKLVR